MTKFTKQKCKPCEGGVRPLTLKQAKDHLKDLEGWRMGTKGKEIQKEYLLKNFVAAVEFIQKIARIAESEGHHPDLHLTGYKKLAIVLTTHAIRGLSLNDFILAAKIDSIA